MNEMQHCLQIFRNLLGLIGECFNLDSDFTGVSVCIFQVAALEPSTDRPTMAPSDLLVVVDNMLQGLGRQLRCCGVDVVILENTDCHDRAGEVSWAAPSSLGTYH